MKDKLIKIIAMMLRDTSPLDIIDNINNMELDCNNEFDSALLTLRDNIKIIGISKEEGAEIEFKNIKNLVFYVLYTIKGTYFSHKLNTYEDVIVCYNEKYKCWDAKLKKDKNICCSWFMPQR